MSIWDSVTILSLFWIWLQRPMCTWITIDHDTHSSLYDSVNRTSNSLIYFCPHSLCEHSAYSLALPPLLLLSLSPGALLLRASQNYLTMRTRLATWDLSQAHHNSSARCPLKQTSASTQRHNIEVVWVRSKDSLVHKLREDDCYRSQKIPHSATMVTLWAWCDKITELLSPIWKMQTAVRVRARAHRVRNSFLAVSSNATFI